MRALHLVVGGHLVDVPSEVHDKGAVGLPHYLLWRSILLYAPSACKASVEQVLGFFSCRLRPFPHGSNSNLEPCCQLCRGHLCRWAARWKETTVLGILG